MHVYMYAISIRGERILELDNKMNCIYGYVKVVHPILIRKETIAKWIQLESLE